MSAAPMRSGWPVAPKALRVVFGIVEFFTLRNLVIVGWGVAIVLGIVGYAVTGALGAALTIPERAENLCGASDCRSSLVKRLGRVRLTLRVHDNLPTVVAMTSLRTAAIGVGQSCGNCTMPTRSELLAVMPVIEGLLWQTPAGELRDQLTAQFVCPEDTQMTVYHVGKRVTLVDTNASTVFQVDVKLGCVRSSSGGDE